MKNKKQTELGKRVSAGLRKYWALKKEIAARSKNIEGLKSITDSDPSMKIRFARAVPVKAYNEGVFRIVMKIAEETGVSKDDLIRQLVNLYLGA